MNPILVSMEHIWDATASIKILDSSVDGELERWICIMVLFCISIQRARTASGFFLSYAVGNQHYLCAMAKQTVSAYCQF